MNSRGFTLIELLIVVAIIAILAAIAVPNFLEAQTRSKVSRAMADMRSLATAMESYAVDNNGRYPFDVDSRGYPWYITDVLSTPVAYISSGSILEDPFRSKVVQVPARRFRFVNYIANNASTGLWPPSPLPGPFTTRWFAGPSQAEHDSGIALFGQWKLSSAGPDKTANTVFIAGDLAYDPTNGTISGGDVLRSQRVSGK
jgi:prepilin-type N-terminal cleavage/methylation domain-containing protein